MKKIKKLCIVTSSRAEYGLLQPLIERCISEKKLKTEVVVTGTHLEKEFGETIRFIEADGIPISEKIPIEMKGKDHAFTGNSASLALSGFSSYFHKNKPSAVILLGDRYEILAVAFAASICGIPVIHLHGGEISEGANDDMFRHAITKLSSFHFTSNEIHRKRVIQMGESPATVKVSGALGIENIRRLKLLNKDEIEKKFGLKIRGPVLLVSFHPATLERTDPLLQLNELFTALKQFKDAHIFISSANADAGGERINEEITRFSKENKNVIFRDSFGQLNYLSLMKLAHVMIGNSSAGIIEAPSLKTATVNIGTRQKGRAAARSVVNCRPETKNIVSAIKKALQMKKTQAFKNPYDHGNASEKIVKELLRIDLDALLPKKFHDIK